MFHERGRRLGGRAGNRHRHSARRRQHAIDLALPGSRRDAEGNSAEGSMAKDVGLALPQDRGVSLSRHGRAADHLAKCGRAFV